MMNDYDGIFVALVIPINDKNCADIANLCTVIPLPEIGAELPLSELYESAQVTA